MSMKSPEQKLHTDLDKTRRRFFITRKGGKKPIVNLINRGTTHFNEQKAPAG